MSDIEDLQRRIASALQRIGAGVETLTAAPAQTGEGQDSAALTEALEEERVANAQLQERLRGLKDSHAAEIESLRQAHAAEIESLRQAHAAEIESLRQAHADEKVRLDSARAEELKTLRAEVEAQSEAMARLDADIQRLRLANQQLRESNAALRAANEEGVGEPHLINKAMLAELEGLRAAREADAAEAGAILRKLEPLLAAAAALPATDEEEEGA